MLQDTRRTIVREVVAKSLGFAVAKSASSAIMSAHKLVN